MTEQATNNLVNGIGQAAVLLRATNCEEGQDVSHLAKVGQLLRDARFLHGGRGADMKIVVSGDHDYVHSAVVAAHSLKLRALVDANEPPLTVDLSTLNRQAVCKAIDFMYTGRVMLTFNELSALLQTAATLVVPSLQRTLESFLLQMSADGNYLIPCLNMAASDTSVVSHRTRVAILRRAVDNWDRVRHSDNFRNLTVGTLCTLLNDDYLPAESELDVFNTVLRWLTVCPEHLESADRVFGCVRFGFMTTTDMLTAADSARNSLIGDYVMSILQTHLADANWFRTSIQTGHSDMSPLRNNPRCKGQAFVFDERPVDISCADEHRIIESPSKVSSAYCLSSRSTSGSSCRRIGSTDSTRDIVTQISSTAAALSDSKRDCSEDSIAECKALPDIDTNDAHEKCIGDRGPDSIMEINALPDMFECSSQSSQEFIGNHEPDSIMEINALASVNPISSQMLHNGRDLTTDSLRELSHIPNLEAKAPSPPTAAVKWLPVFKASNNTHHQ